MLVEVSHCASLCLKGDGNAMKMWIEMSLCMSVCVSVDGDAAVWFCVCQCWWMSLY